MSSTLNWTPQPGHVGNLTPEQQKALDEFRTLLKTEGLFVEERGDDATLLQFLQARKFDIKLAKIMFAACETWRKEFGTNDLLKDGYDFPEDDEVKKYYLRYYHKTDKDGRPVYIERLGRLNGAMLYNVTSNERLLRRFVWNYEKLLQERLPACSAAVGHPVETSCTILDLNGVDLRQFASINSYIKLVIQVCQSYYPETLGKFYIINAPFMFNTYWSIVKPWIDPVTVAHINVLGTDYLGRLLEQVPIENLPVQLGGKCNCSPACWLSDAGPWNT